MLRYLLYWGRQGDNYVKLKTIGQGCGCRFWEVKLGVGSVPSVHVHETERKGQCYDRRLFYHLLSTVPPAGKRRGHYSAEKVEHSILISGSVIATQFTIIYLYSVQCIAVCSCVA